LKKNPTGQPPTVESGTQPPRVAMATKPAGQAPVPEIGTQPPKPGAKAKPAAQEPERGWQPLTVAPKPAGHPPMLAVGRQPDAVRTKPSAQLVAEAPCGACGAKIPLSLTHIKTLWDAPTVFASVGAPGVLKKTARNVCNELLNCQTLVTIPLGWTITTIVVTGVFAPKPDGSTTSSQPANRLVVPATDTDPAVATQPLAVKTKPAAHVLTVCDGMQPAEVRTKPTGHPPIADAGTQPPLVRTKPTGHPPIADTGTQPPLVKTKPTGHPPIADAGTQPPLVKTKPTGQGPTWALAGRVPKEADARTPAVTRIASSNSLIGRVHESLMSASTAIYSIE